MSQNPSLCRRSLLHFCSFLSRSSSPIFHTLADKNTVLVVFLGELLKRIASNEAAAHELFKRVVILPPYEGNDASVVGFHQHQTQTRQT